MSYFVIEISILSEPKCFVYKQFGKDATNRYVMQVWKLLYLIANGSNESNNKLTITLDY